jgi:hypothetical protein
MIALRSRFLDQREIALLVEAWASVAHITRVCTLSSAPRVATGRAFSLALPLAPTGEPVAADALDDRAMGEPEARFRGGSSHATGE